ncbi:DUF7446 family protein [Pseudomonas sp. A014]|uniref:DUF7446 family protein n=1 Tax=Pseudomonas sp. A014 TaxID=3458058 RepID=UPI004035B09B
MKKIRIAVTALAGRVIAGAENAKGNAITEASRQDVTSDFMKAVIDKAEYHGGSFVIEGGDQKWEVTVKDATAEQSAPVERDERAAFEKAVIDKAEHFHPNLEQYGEHPDAEYRDARVEWAWGLWQARAALERKP